MTETLVKTEALVKDHSAHTQQLLASPGDYLELLCSCGDRFRAKPIWRDDVLILLPSPAPR